MSAQIPKPVLVVVVAVAEAADGWIMCCCMNSCIMYCKDGYVKDFGACNCSVAATWFNVLPAEAPFCSFAYSFFCMAGAH